jgi:hypothetical protein
MLMRSRFEGRKTAFSNDVLKIGCASSKGLNRWKRLRD